MPKRGRPRLEFRRDPDRHLMALALAYKALGMSLRGGCEAAIATTEGLPVGPNPNHGHGGHGMSMLNWRYEHHPGAARIEGRARFLRKKLRKLQRDPEASEWLDIMRRAFVVALEAARSFDPGAVEVELVRLTKLAGEPAMAAKLRRLAAVVGSERQKTASGHFKTPDL
jgi:hypothetical protein